MPPPYLLDTDHCVAYLEGRHPGHAHVAPRLVSMSAQHLRVCLFTMMELSEGPWHSQAVSGYHLVRSKLHTFLSWMPVAP
jgi:hypothetical protein